VPNGAQLRKFSIFGDNADKKKASSTVVVNREFGLIQLEMNDFRLGGSSYHGYQHTYGFDGWFFSIR
jgi:hypothetical protein